MITLHHTYNKELLFQFICFHVYVYGKRLEKIRVVGVHYY